MLEATKYTGKINYLRKRHWGEIGSRLSKMRSTAVKTNISENLFDR
jgi:hypothetical protein